MSNGRERVQQALSEIEGEQAKPPAQNPQVRAIDLLTLLALLAGPPTPEEKRKMIFIRITEENIMLREDMKYRDAGYSACQNCGWHHVAPSA